MLKPQISSDSIVSYQWISTDSLLCAHCPELTVQPQREAFYQLTVTDVNNCSATADLRLLVQKDRQVFVPNAFSPNGDGDNDHFVIFGGSDVQVIRQFHIYDRWGELLFSKKDLAPNDPEAGWDGTLDGKPLMPGVVVWIAEIEFVDGYSETYRGTLHLIR